MSGEGCIRNTYEDLAGAFTAELDSNGSSTEVGRHGEVRDGSGGENDDGQLVEEPGTPGPLQSLLDPGSTARDAIELTMKSKPIMTSRDSANTLNAAHSQSEPWVVRW